MDLKSLELTIGHLYPERMNLYGDIGNVIALKRRAEVRGIRVKVENIPEGNDLKPSQCDIYFMGGGQDGDQMAIYRDFIDLKGKQLAEDLDNRTPMLAICGAYQLLGNYFIDSKANKIQGLGLLPIETVAPGPELAQRAIGNIVTRVTHPGISNHYTNLKTLVGFENHSGRTRVNKNKEINILGEVLVGQGDNEDGQSDGVIYKNVIGSYMHGSLLPKNPHLTDYILKQAIEIKHNKGIELPKLDDSQELKAHNYILSKYKLKQ